MDPKRMTDKYPQAGEWYQQASDQTRRDVIVALHGLEASGHCGLTPPIMGGLMALGVLQKEREPWQALIILDGLMGEMGYTVPA
jgi:hypothetical protein